jgi:ubiquinone/menaquinone biosynthesis C-methylase UbiE
LIGKLYERHVLPKVLDACCSTKPVNYQRNKIVPHAKGKILEIGIGSGINIPFYNKANVEKIYGLDPSEELNNIAQKKAINNNLEIDFLLNGAEEIPLPSNSMDTILITYTLCTIQDLESSLKEIKRVMKDDAVMLFCEHGIAPDAKVIKWQNRVNPLWGKLFGGCNINRNIPEIIQSSGFTLNSLDQMYLPSTPKIVGYNYWGKATI